MTQPAVTSAQARLARDLEAYAQSRLGQPVRVGALDRIPGGASRETWRFQLVLDQDAPGLPAGTHRLILRLDPAASLIETDRRTEFGAIRAFGAVAGVPVPQTWWLEDDPAALGAAFLVMGEITGCEANPLKLMQPPYAAHHANIGRQKWMILGRIAAADPGALGLTEIMAPVGQGPCWARELSHWERVIDADALEPQPIQRAAIRWLRAHPPPPPARLAVVHGDYRTGNFLVDPQGEIRGILDWEMAHLGDPLEDLAWSLNRVWCFQSDERRGGLLPREEAIAIWEQASGLRADARALHWWELFSCVKGQAIWLSAGRECQQGSATDSIMALAAWMMTNSQDRASLELLGRLVRKP